MLCRTFTKKVPRWNPTTLLEFLTPEGLTFTGVLIIDKMTRSKDKKKINFCFSNEKIRFFNGKGWRKSFYHRGTSGLLAKIILTHATTIAGLKEPIQKLLEANTIEKQTSVYEKKVINNYVKMTYPNFN